MILIVTNKEDITADLVILELQRREIDFVRFNTEDFPQRAKMVVSYEPSFDGYLLIGERKIPLSSIGSIWYRRPVMPVPDSEIPEKFQPFCIRESLQALNGIWKNLDCFWVSQPERIHQAENKLVQLEKAAGLGFTVPETLISNNPDEITQFCKRLHGNAVIKPIKTGLVEDELVVFTNRILEEDLEKIRGTVLVPSIYQENVVKKYDIRVTVVGNEVFPVEIHSQDFEGTVVDWRRTQNVSIPHKAHILPESIKRKCLSLVNGFGLEFGAIDMILTPDDKYYFLEINPNGQWAWIERRTGVKLTDALVDLLSRRKDE